VNPATRERLFGYQHAFDDAVTRYTTFGIAVLLLVMPLLIALLARRGRIDDKLRRELLARYYSWLVLVPLLLVPILLGAFWTILGVGLLSILCFREFARATGYAQDRSMCFVVVCGIVALTLSTLDNWLNLFMALTPQVIALLAAVAILRDQPSGYIQRLAIGTLGFVLFGSCLTHLGLLANDKNFRPYLILVLLSVELNDVFAYVIGKSLGRRKLAPNTSPNKTNAGAVGAVALTTLLVATLGAFVFQNTVLASPRHLVTLGILISVAGQFGDLMLSSIKRDLGIKDMGDTFPGHGGLLDRFDSILLVAPVVFHYINYFLGVGTEQVQQIFSSI
jgi:phosphatidate cytidylyltransferase